MTEEKLDKKDKKEKKEKKGKPHRDKSVFREYFELIAETAIFVFFVMTFVVQAFQIPTGSMESTLLVGDFLLVNKLSYARPYFPIEKVLLPRKDLERHDIIVFKYPRELQKDFVKRIIALEGEKIEIKNKQVYIDGQAIDEPYKHHSDSDIRGNSPQHFSFDIQRDNFGPVVIPDDSYFMMGDNRDDSADSRYFGFLEKEYIVGRPLIVFWSYEDDSDAYLRTSIPEMLKLYAERIIFFFTKTRWSRMGHLVR